MGINVNIIGASGSGKSYSMRNFSPDEIGVFSVAGKRLPFKSAIKVIDLERKRYEYESKGALFDSYEYIKQALSKSDIKSFVIDDSQYLMAFEEMDSDKKGFDKFNSIGFNFIGLVRFIRSALDDDKIVYFLHHTEKADDGSTKMKTIGKLIDTHYTLEGLSEITLGCEYRNGDHVFITHTNGSTPYKGCEIFKDEVIPNDLKAVDTAIREHFNLQEVK